MNNRSYVFLADGFEEIEALTIVDVMRRADLDVKTVSVMSTKEVTGAHGLKVDADIKFGDENMSAAKWLILPGGMPGATNLVEFKPLCDLLVAQAARGGKIAAICAAPAVVLGQLGLIDNVDVCCYPGFEQYAPEAIWHDSPVVETPQFITGNGPGAAMRFALTIVGATVGTAIAHEIGTAMMFYPRSMNLFI